jgi:hypothetical protein
LIFLPYEARSLCALEARMKDQSAKQAQLITPKQLSIRWQVTTMTLRRMRHAGRLPTLHIGRAIRFDLKDIEQIEADSKA